LVPEFFQEAATAANLGAAVLRWLDDAATGAALAAEFAALHIQLRRDASQQAAAAVLSYWRLAGLPNN